jgi:hypothetical protein
VLTVYNNREAWGKEAVGTYICKGRSLRGGLDGDGEDQMFHMEKAVCT